MKYDSKVEKSHSIGELKSDPNTGHSVKLNAVAKILIILELDGIYKENNYEIRILMDIVMIKQFVVVIFQLITTMEILIPTHIHHNAESIYRVSSNAYSLAFCCS
jgi:nicotinamide riboside transporter PnuC